MNEIDRELDAAWRAASREEPSPTLDQAIRAAARREVGAGPRREGRTRAWLPLATAATVAALAIGIAQLTPRERLSLDIPADVSGPAADKIAANQAPPPAQAAAKAESDVNPSDAGRSDKPAKVQAPALQTRKEKPAPPAADEQRAARTRDRADAAQNVTAERAAAQPNEGEKKQKSELASATTAAPSVDAAPPAGTSRSVPFPASPPRERLAEQAMPAPPPAAARPSPPAATAAGALASNAEPAAVEKRMAMAQSALAEARRESSVAPRPVDEWIKQIRRLITEGKRDDAAKELTAFRAFYKERADSLLPTDLREFKR